VKATCIAVLSDPEVRANREASEIISALRRDALADNFAWQKACRAGKYLDARLDQILGTLDARRAARAQQQRGSVMESFPTKRKEGSNQWRPAV
jgi:hypothetical protein